MSSARRVDGETLGSSREGQTLIERGERDELRALAGGDERRGELESIGRSEIVEIEETQCSLGDVLQGNEVEPVMRGVSRGRWASRSTS